MKRLSGFNLSTKKVRDTLVRAEIVSQQAGTSVMETIDQYAKELSKSDRPVARQLETIARQLRKNRKRYMVYAPYMDKDIITFLKVAEEKSIPAQKVFMEFAPIKEMQDKITGSVRRGLFMPLGMYLIIVIALGSTIDSFKSIREGGVKLSPSINIIMDYFYEINGVFLFFILILFVFFQKKMPIISSVYHRLDSMMALGTVSTMFNLGYSSPDIVGPLIRQFDLKKNKVQRNIGGLVKLLASAKYITAFESADIKISMDRGDVKEPIRRILNDRTDQVSALRETVAGMMKNIALALTSLPLILTVLVFVSIMMESMQQMTSR